MDDSDDEIRYPSRPNNTIYTPSLRSSTRSIRNPNSSYPRNTHYYDNEFQYYNDDDEDSDEQEEEEDEEEENQEFSSGEKNNNDTSFQKKKRKLETLVSNFEFSPRMWSEEESYVLLEMWGERYLELGRRSLRAEDWGEVAEKVTEMIGVDKTEIQCRNQLDVLKNKYKKEITKMEKNGGGGGGFYSKWPFFKKMDMLMNLRMKGHCGLGCGVDSGEYVFMDPRMYLDKSNVLDEMRDSPAGSDAEDIDHEEEEEDEERGLGDDDEPAKLLADSIQRFGQIYEKIENSKRKQMMELEKMRRDFQRDLELQKKQIVERAQAEIAKIRDDGVESDDDEDGETDNISLRG